LIILPPQFTCVQKYKVWNLPGLLMQQLNKQGFFAEVFLTIALTELFCANLYKPVNKKRVNKIEKVIILTEPVDCFYEM
jgi:hypothetical protein